MTVGSGLMTSQRARRPHLAKVTGEVGDLRRDIEEELGFLAAFAVDKWSDVALSDVDAIKTSIASVAADTTYTGATLNGVVGVGTMSPPRNIIITSTSHTDIDAVNCVVTGRDLDGQVVTDTIAITNNGSATDVGTTAFAKVTSIFMPAHTGTAGAFQFGFGNAIGLSRPVASVAGLSSLIKEIVGGVNVTELVLEEWIDVATADTDAFVGSIASNDSDVTYSGAALDGLIGAAVISPPRNFTITSTAHADVDAVDVLVTGLDVYGNVITDTITMTADSGATDAGTVCFAYIISIFIPAHTGTNSLFEMGTGVVVGHTAPVKHINDDPQILSENEAGTPLGVDVLSATYATAATTAPCGSVTHSAAPNGTNDYGLVFVADKGVVAAAAAALPHGTYTPVSPPAGGVDIAVYYEYAA